MLCTHLHVDHVGWNTRLDNGRWVPTFPNAKYVFSKTDRDYFDPTRGEGGKQEHARPRLQRQRAADPGGRGTRCALARDRAARAPSPAGLARAGPRLEAATACCDRRALSTPAPRSAQVLPSSRRTVGAGMLMTCIAMGAMLSLAVFLQPLAAETGWSRTGISTAATLDFLCMGAAASCGVCCRTVSARASWCCLGSALLGLGLVAASRARHPAQFQLLFGGLVGIAAGSFYAPMMAAATSWLEHRRNLAVALVSAGMGIGSMTVSPLAAWLISAFDWRTAMFAIGCLAWVLLLPAALLVRRPPQSGATALAAGPAAAAGSPIP